MRSSTEMAKEEEKEWMDWMEGGMGGYLKEGCVRASSLGFHQRVQIWRHLLLHEAHSLDPPLTSERTKEQRREGVEKKKQWWEKV